jgi:ABC-type dipeptide/oligopeptide/nickel transport system permease component
MRGMSYIVSRFLVLLLTAFIAVTMNFVIFRAAPGDVVSTFSHVPNASPQLQAELRREFGLNEPEWKQYLLYLRELAHGNLGVSYASRKPVTQEVARLLGNTIPMVLLATLVAIALGLVTGVIAAARRGGPLDHSLVGTALTFYALPTQWLAVLLVILFAGVLPTGGMQNPFLIDPSFGEHLLDIAKHMLLPSLTLALVSFGYFTVVVRSAMLETLGADYVLTARATGLSTWGVLVKHGLRNALLPIVALIALSLGFVVSGALLVEIVFSWPGIGRGMYDAVLARDYPMLQGIFLVTTAAMLLANFAADILSFRIDPRLRA